MINLTKYEVLTQVNNNEIKEKEAYDLLYGEPYDRKPKRASFIKLKIKLPEEKGVNILLSVLFCLPIPIFIIKWIVAKRQPINISDQFEIPMKDLVSLISVKGVLVHVKTKTNERILIKTI